MTDFTTKGKINAQLIIVMDKDAGKIMEWSQKAEYLTGFKSHELCGKYLFRQLLSRNHKMEVLGAIGSVQSSGSAVYGFKIPFYTKSGLLIQLDVNVRAELNDKGEAAKVILTDALTDAYSAMIATTTSLPLLATPSSDTLENSSDCGEFERLCSE